MRSNVGDWTYIEDGLPELYTPVYVACRAKDGSRENWVADCMLYGYNREPIKNPWNIPILDLENYEAYAWLPYWWPKAPKERKHGKSSETADRKHDKPGTVHRV